VAVLPFDDRAVPESERHLAAGLLSDLTQRMGELRWFPVIGRDAAARARARGGAPGEALGAGYLVDGSLRPAGERLAVTAELWDAQRDELLWAGQFDQPLAALAAGDSELVDRLHAELEPVVHQAERVRAVRVRAERTVVWDLCKRAELALEREGRAFQQAATELYRKALAIDDDSLHAWAGLALAHAQALYLGFARDRDETAREARRAAERARQTAPYSFEAHYALGRALAMARDDEAALAPLEEALEVNPSSVPALNTVAGALRRTGDNEAALPRYERALRLSPGGAVAHHLRGGIAMVHFAMERFEEALALAREAVAGDPAEDDTKALDFYGIIPASLALLGRDAEARAAWEARPREGKSLRHTARYVGPEGALLVEGLRRAGWDGVL
jgi:TolB-like protein/Tfp pilus assembly protein PilF